MDKKSRILDLVKKNIITADEAIELLEKIEATDTVSPVEPIVNEEVNNKPEEEKIVDPFDQVEMTEEERIFEAMKDLDEAQFNEENIPDEEDMTEEEKKEFSDQLNQMFNQARSEFEKAKPQIKEASKQTAEVIKNTFSLLSGTVKDYMKSEDNPFAFAGGATTTVEKDYEFSDIEVIDIQETNGRIELSVTDGDKVEIQAVVKIYGSLEDKDALELFEEKSSVTVENNELKFTVLNNRMNAHLKVKLPKSKLNHLTVKTINGKIFAKDILVEDAYLKSTNGEIKVEESTLTNLELEGVNGDIVLVENNILETTISTVNGSIVGNGNLEKIKVKLVNGDIKLSLNHEGVKSIKAVNANGTIKVAVPRKLGLNGEIKTTFGKIFDKLEDLSTVTEQNEISAKSRVLKREGAKALDLNLTTTTGNIYIKDADK